jgi:hypothetical protein
MKEKHFVIALALLVLPVSFGGGLSAGSKAAAAMDAANLNSRMTAKLRSRVVHGFTTDQVATLFAGSPIGRDDMGPTSGLFVSSFDATKSREDALAVVGSSSNVNNSAAGFPMFDSFNGSDTAQRSGAPSSGPFGIGAGGGNSGPGGPGPVNPNVPISTPEPGTLLLLASGLAMLGGLARRRAVSADTISK